MCSIGEDDFGDEGGLHTMPTEKLSTEHELQGICKKCGQHGFVIKLSCREPECRVCFLAYVRHKFRAALGSSKVLPKDAKVLLAIDGSAESLVLLDMMHYAQTQNNFKRLHCAAQVLYIDDLLLLQPDELQHRKHVTEVVDVFNKFNAFPKFILRLDAEEGTMPTPFANIDGYQQQLSKRGTTQFDSALQAMRSLTARQDFVKLRRSRLLAAACKHLQCDFVFVPAHSTQLAAQLLTDITLGRGGAAALDVALVDDRLEGVRLVRPLKDLNDLEISSYLQVQQLQPIKLREYGDQQGAAASLQNLTNAFVRNLQQNYASTVSTVFRTGDKIAPNNELHAQLQTLQVTDQPKQQRHNCAFCNSSLDYFDSSTLLATEFSRLVSETGTTMQSAACLEDKARHNLYDAERERYPAQLCHGCRNIQNECLNKTPLV